MCFLFSKLVFKLKYGNRIKFGKRFRCRRGMNFIVEEDGKIVLGNNVFFNNYCSVNCLKGVTIGDACIFGEGVKIYDHNHIFNKPNLPIYRQGFSCEEVIIEENCWIGSNVVILKGAHIGKGCVIGAGCIIKSHIPDHSIVTNSNVNNIKQINYKE